MTEIKDYQRMDYHFQEKVFNSERIYFLYCTFFIRAVSCERNCSVCNLFRKCCAFNWLYLWKI